MKGSAPQYTTHSHVAALQRSIPLQGLKCILRTAGGITTGGGDVRGKYAFIKLDKAYEYMVNKLSELILHDYRDLYENRG